MASIDRLKVAFYGDDFTGSSENLAQFHRSGLRAKLYLRLPDEDSLRRDARDFDVLGIAGTARALAPAEMEAELVPAFRLLGKLGCDFLQYKICSTFDSAPDVGSFGKVLDVAARELGKRDVAVVAAAPDFGRYTAFGQHFARFGSRIERLDRHPSMSTHPRTPMREADLRLHLAAQTDAPFVNAMLPLLREPDACRTFVRSAFEGGNDVIFDGVHRDDLARTACLLWEGASERPLLALASQGLAQGLGRWLVDNGLVPDPSPVSTELPGVPRLLVLSGSCALLNGRQIDVADAAGWTVLHLDPGTLAGERECRAEMARILPAVCEALEQDSPTIVYTARGTEGRLASGGDVPAGILGPFYSELARAVRARVPLPRVVFAGGDSSSFAVREIGADALQISVFDRVQNSHACRLSAPRDGSVDGLEVMLKGGQVGSDDYFLRALSGAAN